MSPVFTAIVLGIVEGLTEFIPVSSTGHLVLATRFLGYQEQPWEVFNIVIQLPAIMAVVVLYWRTFRDVVLGALRREGESLHFIRNVLIAFVPSAVLGVLLKSKIDALLENPTVVASALVIGGIVILIVEKFVRHADYVPVGKVPVSKAIAVGFAQCIAMVPGVSRSGATIMGGLALGLNRKTAAELSFFLAVPTMFGATAKQLFDHRHELAAGTGEVGWSEIAVGSVVSFVVALIVIKAFVAFISRSGFAPFAWYRIVAGAAALFLLTR
jgi:undecaprenyl-diphosphatase